MLHSALLILNLVDWVWVKVQGRSGQLLISTVSVLSNLDCWVNFNFFANSGSYFCELPLTQTSIL